MSFVMNPPSRPFLPYNNPSISSVEDLNSFNFNPKRISEQSARPPPSRSQPMAPYVQLDQSTNAKIERAHRQNAAPISKKGLLILRIIAISLRVGQLAGAMGLLVCMLFVRKLDDITGWICRVPPAVAIFHIVYYIYHVSGSDRVRTPRSSVSYFLFASTIDLAVISFYAFIAILSWKQYQVDADAKWETIFNNQEISLKIFLTVFLIACSAGGLALLSLANTLYLVRVFRQLASLSPDQNPFLDEKDTYTQLPSKRWSASTTASSAPSLPESSKAVPFLSTRRSDMSSRDSVQYSNIPVPPPHTSRNSMYPATGHLYPASGPVYDSGEKSIKEESTKATKKESNRKGKKSWGNLKAPTLPKRQDSGASSIAEATRSTSSTLHPANEGDGREWSFSFRKRSGAQAGAP